VAVVVMPFAVYVLVSDMRPYFIWQLTSVTCHRYIVAGLH
jgi:hypothetical protein